ncbi:hypothetical protein PQ469_18350 [Mucilaginibacter sp. KACC 22773]|uniref:hypothetical protein n=1 Tax=Mucilaginibacter sp. KACC 22773 TaxID=3025671 RepID=UPI00236526E0|nr:hypothetical protein [Mucilaginibacter sp. KACC 22773]WDF75852.1 hypothetical protein PQ469_18350 [Mucilaginibacter sp. KACC 22773]
MAKVKKEKSIPIYTESIVLPVLPLLLGLYCIYIAVPSLIIELESQKHTLSLEDIYKDGRMGILEIYLKEKLRTRFYDNCPHTPYENLL